MKKLLFTVFSLLFAVLYLEAQKFETALMALSAQHQPDKIYIHYDKEYYVAGETIWFKAYLYSDGKPSAAANNLYLQFTDSKGQVVRNKKIPVLGAVAKGSVEVPDSLPQGNYFIRALTPEMLNDDEAFIYKKNIFVFKLSATAKEKSPPQNISLQFFPESGHLVDGILTVVGFKATDQWGTPVEINGIIRSGEGTTISSFKSYHDGIGKVQFKAQAGKTYIAEVETDAGKRSYQLPEVKASGINLKVQDEKGGKKFQLSRSEKDKAQFGSVWVVADINNQVIYENEITFEDYPSVIGHLVTDSLPSGILHFSVFNKDGMPLAERLSFVDNKEYKSSATVTSTKISVEKRAANDIELNFAEAIQRSCSVSITDASGGSFADNDNIWSRLLLTSDLKGYVYNPAWYFSVSNDTTKQAIDNLLLTHGWSRFNWTKILANELPVKKYSDQPMISITGRVTDDKKNELLSGGNLNIFLEAEDSTSRNYDVLVDAAGRFRMDSLLFMGKAKLFYAYKDSKGKTKPALVSIDSDTLRQPVELIPSGMLYNMIIRDINPNTSKEEVNTRYDYLKSRLDETKELEKVTVQAKSNKKPIDIVNEKYTTGVFKSPGKVEIDNINNPANDKSINVVDYVKNRIQQLELQGGRFVNRKNISLMSGQKWAVGIFLDEVPADINQLRVLRMDDVALVKFYEAGFVGVGSGSPGGALAVYTRDKSNRDEKPDKLSFVEYKGYSISKEFYTPDYSNKEIRHPASDNRTTLYWNPDVYTDTETTSVKLNFFNNDFSKKFKVVVEGFDAMGKLIHTEKIIEFK
ncbi:MAG: hypothetical protein LH619_14350 [Chitinophagaceae bacterium]|nr:hypothetical protein [Chitinophagaceae bacterium]